MLPPFSFRRAAPLGAIGLLALGLAVSSANANAAVPAKDAGTREAPLALEVVAADNFYSQNMPLPKSSASWWTLYIGAKLKVSGVKAGETVEVRVLQPGSGTDMEFSQRPVEEGGTIRVGWGMTSFSLAEAKVNAAKYATPMTVEVRRSPSSSPASVTISELTIGEPLFFRNVTMKKTRTGMTFTGVVVNEAGKPVKSVPIMAVQLSDYYAKTITRGGTPALTNAAGKFTIAASGATRGTVGLQITVVPPSGTFAWYFSRTFAYNPAK